MNLIMGRWDASASLRRTVVAAAVVTIALLSQSLLGGALAQAGLTPQASRYSELAFAHPADFIASSQGQQRDLIRAIRFVITNHEGRTITYRWRVTSRHDGTTRDLGQGQVTIAREGGVEQSVVLAGPSLESGTRVEVLLVDQALRIAYTAGGPRSGVSK